MDNALPKKKNSRGRRRSARGAEGPLRRPEPCDPSTPPAEALVSAGRHMILTEPRLWPGSGSAPRTPIARRGSPLRRVGCLEVEVEVDRHPHLVPSGCSCDLQRGRASGAMAVDGARSGSPGDGRFLPCHANKTTRGIRGSGPSAVRTSLAGSRDHLPKLNRRLI